MGLIQQTPNCSDFDVALGNAPSPAFRVLLPEHVSSELRVLHQRLAHTIPGDWRDTPAGKRGIIQIENGLEVSVDIERERDSIAVEMTVRNLSTGVLRHVAVDICAGVNHLPGRPGWCNREFIPFAPLDRDEHGRYWYEQVTPRGLKALTTSGWRLMHPRPDHPSAEGLEPYASIVSERPVAFVCGARSYDGRKLFYQAWDVPCYYASPVSGNACMHLSPVVSESLESGASATTHGHVGIFEGDWDALAGEFAAFHGA